jgi:peptidoglycan/xylan/chitin deacetylase (PgdA/CDA1 family)
MEVTLEQFEHQLGYLMDEWEVVSLEDAIARSNEPDSHKLVVLTFDDGYSDTFTTAFPVLRSVGLPFTLYVSSGHVESGRSRYPDLAAEPLNWEMIGTMLESGLLTLGSHTHSHVDVRELSAGGIERELARCDDLIEERVGVEARHFAYPWGYWSQAADRLVRERYESAVLGAAQSSASAWDPYRIHRYPIQLSDGMRYFPARLRGGLLLEERVRRLIRGYRGP